LLQALPRPIAHAYSGRVALADLERQIIELFRGPKHAHDRQGVLEIAVFVEVGLGEWDSCYVSHDVFLFIGVPYPS
jgi:hypothetical protein